ncbi:unnamed protein product [Prunus brigantina]
MSQILRGVGDDQNLSNNLRAQNEILQESHAELADHANWDETIEEVDDLTSQLKNLVTGELRSVWDRLGQVEKSKMPRGPEFTEEEIPLPYTQDLLQARVVGDSKAPKIPLYDGMTEPYDHLDNFSYAMKGRGANEATKCRMFPTTLKGPTTSWFKRLARESISSFAELRKVFLERYMIISDRLYTANDLSTVRQRPDEKLRDYITRFNNEYARCEGNPLKTYKDLIREATCYSRAEQLNLARKATAGSVSGAHAPHHPRDKRANDYAYDRSAKRKKGEIGSAPSRNDTRSDKQHQYTNYTPLNKSKGDIFSVIASELPHPARRRFPYRGKKDDSKYCKCHRDYGHHTDDCY